MIYQYLPDTRLGMCSAKFGIADVKYHGGLSKQVGHNPCFISSVCYRKIRTMWDVIYLQYYTTT